MSDRPIFLLFDGHAVIYRAYYGLPPLTDAQGRTVHAAYGFSRIVLSAINEFEPTYLAVTFDHPKPTFRHQKYKEYKAHRPKMPDDLQPQIPMVKDITSALNIPAFEIEGFEADDLIGTLSYWLDHQPEKLKVTEDILTVIVTGDKDMLQLVDDNTHVWIPGRGRQSDIEYDATTVKEKMGVTPSQIVDMKALMGDASDNIPGIKGIGKKTAVKLLMEYGTLDQLLEEVEAIEREEKKPNDLLKGSLLKKLMAGKDLAYLSKKLAKIDRDAPIEVDLNLCKVENYDKTKVVELFKELDFTSLLSLLPSDKFESEVQQALF
ncbi:MAG: DNA polymerase [Microgenomates bacterium 39_7]|nr:MAG: DNA polymerase [Microgenomates bacterium 39_7]